MLRKKLAEAYVDILGRYDKFKGALGKIQRMLKSSLSTMAKWAKRGAMVIGAALAAGLAYATKAAMVQEDAEADLAAALRVTGDATTKNIKSLKDYAAALQKTTTYGDEEILAQMAYAKNLGVTTGQLKEAAKAAIGLAAKYKIDLKTSMMLIGRAALGQTQMLTRYGIVLAETLSPQEKFNEVLRIGAKAFVLAEEKAKTSKGTLSKLWNVLGDIAERIGKPLAEKIKIIALRTLDWAKANEKLIATKVGEWIDNLASGLEKLKPAITFVAKHWKAFVGIFTVALLAPAIVAIGKIAVVLTKAGIAIAVFTKGVVLTASATFAAILAAFVATMATIGHLIDKQIAYKKAVIKYGKAATKEEIASYKRLIGAEKALTDLRKKNAEAVAKLPLAKKKRTKEAIASGRKSIGALDEVEQVVVIKTKDELLALEDFYKRAGGHEKELAKIRLNLRRIEYQEIAKATGVTEKEALKMLRAEKTKSSKEEAKEAENALRKKINDEKAAIYTARGERLRMQQELFTDAKGKEAELADVEKQLMERQAKEYAKMKGIEYKEALAILKAKEKAAGDIVGATEAARIGFAGLEQAWSQIATGASQTDKDQLKETKQIKKYTKETAEHLKTMKTGEGGFGP